MLFDDDPPRKYPITIDRAAQRWVGITDTNRELWSRAYPALDLESELAGAMAWVLANPVLTKRRRDWPRFLVGWLKRAQNDRAYRSPEQPRGPDLAQYDEL